MEASTNTTPPHTLDIVDKMLAGTISPEQCRELLQTYDRNWLSPIGYGVLEAARNTDRLMPLLELLRPSAEGSPEKASLDQVVELLTQIAESQAAMAAQVTELQKRMLAVDNATFDIQKRLQGLGARVDAAEQAWTPMLSVARWLKSKLADKLGA